MNIADRIIGRDQKPFVIAEMSGNHNQSLDRALKLIDLAADAKVDAIKLQTYTADTITIDHSGDEFRISDPNSLWTGKTLYDLYETAHTPWEWHGALFQRAHEKGLIIFSSPFDDTAVDFLESLGAPAYKIASFEFTDFELIRKVLATGKPLILSTGMASLAEIDETVKMVRSSGNENFALLKCTSSYPADPLNSNISTISYLRDIFGCEVGLSDHTMGIGVAAAAVAMGATIIEKHFTDSRSEGGVDSAFSLEPDEMKSLVIEAERAHQSIGKVNFAPSGKNESNAVSFRRSLYICKDIKRGEAFTKENLRSIRPGLGLPVKNLPVFLGKSANQDIKRGTPLSWNFLG